MSLIAIIAEIICQWWLASNCRYFKKQSLLYFIFHWCWCNKVVLFPVICSNINLIIVTPPKQQTGILNIPKCISMHSYKEVKSFWGKCRFGPKYKRADNISATLLWSHKNNLYTYECWADIWNETKCEAYKLLFHDKCDVLLH